MSAPHAHIVHRGLAFALFALSSCGAVTAMEYEWLGGEPDDDPTWRRLQSQGALDLNICNKVSGPITNVVGTVHDDQTTKADCSKGQCSSADKGKNGYGDNLHCGKTLMAPKGSTIELTFTHFNLGSGKNCPKGGCDHLEVRDGKDKNAKLLWKGTGTKRPPALSSTGQYLYVLFVTDVGNYEFQVNKNKADPGFFADWRFVQHVNINNSGKKAGGGICPVSKQLTAAHGTLHDDERSGVDCVGHMNVCGSGKGDAGYKDNINCQTTITAPKGEQIKLTFTQMNLEYRGCGAMNRPPKWKDGTYGRGCPEGGCDYVAVYDGPSTKSPMIGKFSGQPKHLPVIVSSTRQLHIHFVTDGRNCGITANKQKGDPGWFADWDFVENGQDICKPEAAVLIASRGVLHDDTVDTHVDCSKGGCNSLDKNGHKNGYKDNANCGVRIRGPKGSVVNLHMAAMNLESCARAHSVGYRGKCDRDPDRIEIYDGANANARKIREISGDITDAANQHDTFTSSGRDMYVRFVTDGGNWGLSKTKEDPGFYAEWQIIKDGQKCEHFLKVPHKAITGHNNEMIQGSVQQCEVACCARDWCKSFEYDAKSSRCNLADVDASRQFADTISSTTWNLYERTTMAKVPVSMGKSGCSTQLTQLAKKINPACCGHNNKLCGNGAPRTCTEECAAIWMPYAEKCSEWVKQALPAMAKVTAICEKEEYGTYHPGRRRGRCNELDIYDISRQMAPACCGDKGQYCRSPATSQVGYNKKNGVLTLPNPQKSGKPFCSPECGDMFEEFYAECHTRLEVDKYRHPGIAHKAESLLKLCQLGTDDGHRRLSTAKDDFEVSDGI